MGDTGANERFERNANTSIGLSFDALNKGSDDYLVARLLKDLATSDYTIAAAVKTAAMPYPKKANDGGNFPKFYETSPKFMKKLDDVFLDEEKLNDKLCRYLSKKSEKEMDDLERSLEGKSCLAGERQVLPGKQVGNAVELATAAKTLQLAEGKKILTSSKCISCHDSATGHNVGPAIPFGNPQKFSRDNANNSLYDETYIAKAKHLISDPSVPPEKRMPLNQVPLTQDEQDAVLAYLEYMASQPPH